MGGTRCATRPDLSAAARQTDMTCHIRQCGRGGQGGQEQGGRGQDGQGEQGAQLAQTCLLLPGKQT